MHIRVVLAASAVSGALLLMLLRRRRREQQEAACCEPCEDEGMASADLARLRQAIRDGTLLHPQDKTSFVDLARAIALCCGQAPSNAPREAPAAALAAQLGGPERRHLVLVLCDGMGCDILERHLPVSSFLRRHNEPERLRAVFPATTPAALTTLATAVWPGQHGAPGWDLRDQAGVEFPGEPAHPVVQLRVLHDKFVDMRTGRPAAELGFASGDAVLNAPPWATLGSSRRRFLYVNAYNGTAFTDWYQGPYKGDTYRIAETAAETIGTPEGSAVAVRSMASAVDAVAARIREADARGWSTYTYLYTAHPDKHMHALGVDAPEVAAVVRGLDKELGRLWAAVQGGADGEAPRDVAMVVTADHGHVTVQPSEMVALPPPVLRTLEYANVGVHGKGRHAFLHVRSGRAQELEAAWAADGTLRAHFLLLRIDDAVAAGLFGPEPPLPAVRPRLGDYVAISLGAHTLVSPKEKDRFCGRCQGAHGSLAPADMRIPFVCCTRDGAE